jgi:hypothetical protein
MNWAVGGGIERRFHPKSWVYKPIQAMLIPPWRAPHALSHFGPSKEIYQRSLKNPSRPKPDYHLVRLETNPIGSAAYLTLPLPPVYLPLDVFA